MNEQEVRTDASRALLWGYGRLIGLGATGVVIAALVVAYFLKGHGGGNKPKIDTKTQKSIDSLAATKPAFEQHKDSIIKVIVYDTTHAAAVDRAANQSRARAQVAEHRADSLAKVAQTHGDSGVYWHAAYDARTVEADTLRKTVAQKDSALRDTRAAFTNISSLYGADTLRRIATERVNEGLVKDIAKLEQPCRVPGTFGRIPCPSRTVTLVLTTIAIEGIHLAKKSAKP